MKWIKRIALGILVLLVSYILVAAILSLIPANPPEQSCQKDKTIFIASTGIHLDIFIPKIYMEESFMENLDAPVSTAYIAFGWGDKDFYVKTPEWSDLNLLVAGKALFIPTQPVVHAEFIDQTYSNWERVSICEHQLQALKAYIMDSFIRDEQGNFIATPGYGPKDRFYDAKGKFMFYRTCNIWVNQGLKAAEIRTSVWSPFTFGVLYHLE